MQVQFNFSTYRHVTTSTKFFLWSTALSIGSIFALSPIISTDVFPLKHTIPAFKVCKSKYRHQKHFKHCLSMFCKWKFKPFGKLAIISYVRLPLLGQKRVFKSFGLGTLGVPLTSVKRCLLKHFCFAFNLGQIRNSKYLQANV